MRVSVLAGQGFKLSSGMDSICCADWSCLGKASQRREQRKGQNGENSATANQWKVSPYLKSLAQSYGITQSAKIGSILCELTENIPQGLKPTLILRHLRHD